MKSLNIPKFTLGRLARLFGLSVALGLLMLAVISLFPSEMRQSFIPFVVFAVTFLGIALDVIIEREQAKRNAPNTPATGASVDD